MIFNKVIEGIDAIAVIDGCQNTLSYVDLQDSVLRFASYLKDVDPDTIFQIQVGRSLELIEAVVGILANGFCVSIVDPALPDARQRLIAIEGAQTIDLAQLAQIKRGPRRSAVLETVPEALAYIVFTSGSTGTPKGVMIEHQNLKPMVQGFLAAAELTVGDRMLQFHSISFDAFFEELLCPLAAGSTIVVRNDVCISSIPKFIEFCSQTKVTVLDLPTAFWNQLVAELPRELWPELRACILGGSALAHNNLQHWQQHTGTHDIQLINTYGPSETTVVTSAVTIDNASMVADGCLPIGRPYPGTEFAIEEGELVIKGPQVGRGYFNDPEKTAEAFWVDRDVRCYRTGDLVFEREGLYYYRGRRDNQVKVSGHRVELNAVEQILNTFDAIYDSKVLVQDERLVAYVVGQPASAQRELIEGWMQTNDVTTDDQHAYDFQIRGWNSSKTGLPFSDAEMRNWLHQTMAKINRLSPTHVLEIGCGTGLIFFNLIGCQSYVGVDISEPSIDHIRTHLDKSEVNAEFHRMPAHQIEAIAGEFDIIIMNSVCQYFPDITYFIEVVNQCLSKLSPGGSLFLGDIRDYSLQREFYEWLEKDPDVMIANEEELLIHPAFFSLFTNEGITNAIVTRKDSSHYFNEMTGFRYDVIVTVNDNPNRAIEPAIASSMANNPGLTAARERASLNIMSEMMCTQPSYMVPASITWLDKFPLNANGKVNTKALPVGIMRFQGGTPPETALQQELVGLWEHLFNISGIGIDEAFNELGGNSLLWIRAMGLIDQRFPGAAQLSFKTRSIRSIADAIGNLQAGTLRTTYMDDIYLHPKSVQSSMILVTGATGFLGPHLVAELLERDDRPTVLCLSRSESITKLISLLEDIGRWSNKYVNRLRIITGDLSRPRLGLDLLTYEMLGRSITEVFHCAAKVDLISPYEALKSINVCATRELISMCKTGTQINLMSTLDIYSPNTGYAQSKIVAEGMLAQATDLAPKVFRLGQLVNPDMKAKPNDILTMVVNAITTTGKIPENYCSLKLDMVPVDQAARAITIHASDRSASLCELGATQPVPITNVVGDDHAVVSYDEWIKTVSASGTKLGFLTHAIQNPEVISDWLGWSPGSEKNWDVLSR